jgi:hypothetical protein
MPIELVTAQVSTTATSADNVCEKQNWPYYSKECLRGEGSASAPRQVHLQPTSATTAMPKLALAYPETAERKRVEFRQVTETPRRPKVRQTPRYASRPILRPHQMQPESAGVEQALLMRFGRRTPILGHLHLTTFRNSTRGVE